MRARTTNTVGPLCALVVALAAPPAVSQVASSSASDARVLLTPDEIELAHEFSPLPEPPADPTNAFADDPAAARLGQALFFDTRLSGDGSIACATCHQPDKGWGDGLPLAQGVARHSRHSPTLWNVAYNRWWFWGGRKDTLWSQALDPLEDPREHATSRLQVVHVLHDDPAYRRAYESVFGELPALDDAQRFPPHGRPVRGDPQHPHALAWAGMRPADRQAVDRAFANVGKAIAAFERRIVSRRAPFDVFVEGLADGDPAKLGAMPAAAQRGFALFVGKGQCLFCHDGPNFTDLEFHANRVPSEGLDTGRAEGIQRLHADPFNSRSVYADDGGRSGRTKLAIQPKQPHVPGDFKTPTLRNVTRTAPYMHQGQLASLEDVLEFYSTLEGAAPPDVAGEQLIQPRMLSDAERDDLLAFFEALTDEQLPAELLGPPPSPELP